MWMDSRSDNSEAEEKMYFNYFKIRVDIFVSISINRAYD